MLHGGGGGVVICDTVHNEVGVGYQEVVDAKDSSSVTAARTMKIIFYFC